MNIPFNPIRLNGLDTLEVTLPERVDIVSLERFDPKKDPTLWFCSHAKENVITLEGRSYAPVLLDQGLFTYVYNEKKNVITNEVFQKGECFFTRQKNSNGTFESKAYQLGETKTQRVIRIAKQAMKAIGVTLFTLIGFPILVVLAVGAAAAVSPVIVLGTFIFIPLSRQDS